MTTKPTNTSVFGGFVPPEDNYSKMPHQLVECMHMIDSLAEFKVIIYVLRHTWGYHNSEKRISLDEFQNGRKNKGYAVNQKRLDKGVGMAINSIKDGIRRAVEHGFIVVEYDKSDPARQKSVFALKMAVNDGVSTSDGRVSEVDSDGVSTSDGRVSEVDSDGVSTSDGRVSEVDSDGVSTSDGRVSEVDGDRVSTSDGRVSEVDGDRVSTSDGRVSTSDGWVSTSDGRLSEVDTRTKKDNLERYFRKEDSPASPENFSSSETELSDKKLSELEKVFSGEKGKAFLNEAQTLALQANAPSKPKRAPAPPADPRRLSAQQAMVGALARATRMDPALSGGWLARTAADLLKNGYTPEQVDSAFGKDGPWYKDWPGNNKGKLSPPKVGQISEYLPRYVADAKEKAEASNAQPDNPTDEYFLAAAEKEVTEAWCQVWLQDLLRDKCNGDRAKLVRGLAHRNKRDYEKERQERQRILESASNPRSSETV